MGQCHLNMGPRLSSHDSVYVFVGHAILFTKKNLGKSLGVKISYFKNLFFRKDGLRVLYSPSNTFWTKFISLRPSPSLSFHVLSVVLVGSKKKMVRTNAMANVAMMKDTHFTGVPARDHPCDSICFGSPSKKGENSVSITVFSVLPKPASVSFFNFAPKPLFVFFRWLDELARFCDFNISFDHIQGMVEVRAHRLNQQPLRSSFLGPNTLEVNT